MKKLGLLVVLACIACGSEESDPSIVGSWLIENNNAGLGLTLAENGRFNMSRLKVVSAAGAQVEMHSGTYEATGTEIVFEQEKSTCLDDVRSSETGEYKLSGDTLALRYPEWILNFKRNQNS